MPSRVGDRDIELPPAILYELLISLNILSHCFSFSLLLCLHVLLRDRSSAIFRVVFIVHPIGTKSYFKFFFFIYSFSSFRKTTLCLYFNPYCFTEHQQHHRHIILFFSFLLPIGTQSANSAAVSSSFSPDPEGSTDPFIIIIIIIIIFLIFLRQTIKRDFFTESYFESSLLLVLSLILSDNNTFQASIHAPTAHLIAPTQTHTNKTAHFLTIQLKISQTLPRHTSPIASFIPFPHHLPHRSPMSAPRVALQRLLSENVLQLRSVPVPGLAATAQRYVDSLRAVKAIEAIPVHQAKLDAFLETAGRALQKQLEDGERECAGYAGRVLLDAQQRSRRPLEVERNPGVVLKKDCLEGCTDGTQAGVAAALIHGVACWIRDAVRDGVPLGGAAEDMAPLGTEFGRSLVPSREKDTVQTMALEQLRHVIVLHDGHANLVRVLDDAGQRVEERRVIQRALEVILSTTPDEDNPAPVSVLTAGSRGLWGQAYGELVKTPENAETLRLFQEGILVVCLDSKSWAAEDGADVRGAAVLHGGQEEVENRWYDKHQVIVSADGQVGFNFESTASWMPHWCRWVEDVLAAARAGDGAGSSGSAADAAAVSTLLRPLVVTYGKSFASHIRTARQEALALVASAEGRGVSLPVGSKELSCVGVSGDAFIQLALHLAHHRRRGCLCPTSRVVSLCGFYGGLTDIARTATLEALQMCEAFKQNVKPGKGAASTTKREEVCAMVRSAAARHEEVIRAAAGGEGVDRHIRILQRLAEKSHNEVGLSFFADPLYQTSTRFLMNTTELSRPWVRLVSVGPSDSRGCGIGYTIDTSQTRLHVVTAANSPLCSCDEQSQSIVTAAMDLYRILGGMSIRAGKTKTTFGWGDLFSLFRFRPFLSNFCCFGFCGIHLVGEEGYPDLVKLRKVFFFVVESKGGVGILLQATPSPSSSALYGLLLSALVMGGGAFNCNKQLTFGSLFLSLLSFRILYYVFLYIRLVYSQSDTRTYAHTSSFCRLRLTFTHPHSGLQHPSRKAGSLNLPGSNSVIFFFSFVSFALRISPRLVSINEVVSRDGSHSGGMPRGDDRGVPHWRRGRVDGIPPAPFKLELSARHSPQHRGEHCGAGGQPEDLRPFPADLQIRRCSLFGLQFLLTSWYFFCLIAFVIIWVPGIRWNILDLCGDRYGVPLMTSMTSWDSRQCLQDTTSTSGGGLLWRGLSTLPTQRRLYAYRRVAVQFPRPPAAVLQENQREHFSVSATLRFYTANADGTILDDENSPTSLTMADLTVHCPSSQKGCTPLRIPDSSPPLGPHSVAQLHLHDITPSVQDWLLAEHKDKEIAVAMIYQRPGYTLQLLIWRYVLLLGTFLRLLLFISLLRWSHMTDEQIGMLFLQIGLLLYLNPLCALCVVTQPTQPILAFIELRLPYYYFSLLTLFVISVMVSALPWSVRVGSDESQENLGLVQRKIQGFKRYWRNVHYPYTAPRWVTLLYMIVFFAVMIIDVIQVLFFSDNAFWTVNVSPTQWSSDVLTWVVEGLIMFSCVAAIVVYWFLPQSFKYILIRARWLGVHFLMQIFLPLVLIILAEIIAFNFYDPILVPGIACTQPFVTLSSVLVSAAVMHAMLSVYMGTRRPPDLPIDAADHRWKQMAWPEQWIAWVRVHGNGQYFFDTEAEERTFCARQERYRQHLKGVHPPPDHEQSSARQEITAPPSSTKPTGGSEEGLSGKEAHTPTSSNQTPPPAVGLEQLMEKDRAFEAAQRVPPLFLLPVSDEEDEGQQHKNKQISQQVEGVVARFTVSTLKRETRGTQHAHSAPRTATAVIEVPLTDDTIGASEAVKALLQPTGGRSHAPGQLVTPVLYRFFYFLRSLLFRAGDLWWSWCAPAPPERGETDNVGEAQRYAWDIAHFPIFFVLETAIDCCNLSVEVYNPLQPRRRRDIANVEFLHPEMSTATLFDMSPEPTEVVSQSSPRSHAHASATSTSRTPGPAPSISHTRAVSQVLEGEMPVPPSGTQWMNIQQYGYRLRCVQIVRKVQFLIAVMDTRHPAHEGKTPRIVIAFRGTSRMSNVKKDSAYWFVRFSEGEDVPHEMGDNEESAADLHTVSSMNAACPPNSPRNPAVASSARAGQVAHREQQDPLDEEHAEDGSQDASSLEADDEEDREGEDPHNLSFTPGPKPTLMQRLENMYSDDAMESPKVHAGFLSLWNELRPHVRRKLRRVEREMDRKFPAADFEVVLTGHSLGGALAVLCAYHLSRSFLWWGGKAPRLIVYTYGQPRVGNQSFERTYNKYVRRSFQVMNESDLVARACGGVSAGTTVRIDRHGNCIVQPSEAEQFIRPTAGRGFSVVHHLLVNYATALNAMAADSREACKLRVGEPYPEAMPQNAQPHLVERKGKGKATTEAKASPPRLVPPTLEDAPPAHHTASNPMVSCWRQTARRAVSVPPPPSRRGPQEQPKPSPLRSKLVPGQGGRGAPPSFSFMDSTACHLGFTVLGSFYVFTGLSPVLQWEHNLVRMRWMHFAVEAQSLLCEIPTSSACGYTWWIHKSVVSLLFLFLPFCSIFFSSAIKSISSLCNRRHLLPLEKHTPSRCLALPDVDEIWSSWYVEGKDDFQDFQSFTPTTPTTTGSAPGTGVQPSGASFRTMSARQVSGQFEDEVAKSWEEDWEDEDLEDTYDAIMGRISHYAAQKAANA
eukprot:gene762-405_t